MNILFYISSIIAIIATIMAITRLNAVHALLYLIVSLISAAFIFYILGAPFIAALEIIIYAGAIMVLFIFVVMMLNLGEKSAEDERKILFPGIWIGPSILTLVLLIQFVFILFSQKGQPPVPGVISPKEVGLSLFSTYLLGVELSGLLLTGGIVGAYHIGKGRKKSYHRFLQGEREGEYK